MADDRFSTVDWVNRQSSLNDAQAHLDDDGWFRGVVSTRDPGVWNWLDKADVPWGILQARFYRAPEYPEATVTKAPAASVLDHLPSGTRTITPDERTSSCGIVAEMGKGQRVAFFDTIADFGFYAEAVAAAPAFVTAVSAIADTCAHWDGTDPIRILTREGYRTP